MQTAPDSNFYASGFPKSIHRHELNVPVNERLRVAREHKKYTLTRAARELNKKGVACAISTLQSYEQAGDSQHRRYPSIKMLISLANLYDCSTDYLLGISDEPQRYTPDLLAQIKNNQSIAWRDQDIDEHQKNMIVYKIEQIMDL
jgi:transcriptional regulator with XRE-family HTH domain